MKSIIDPTKTLTLRNRAVAEINRRFARIARAIAAAFSLGDFSSVAWPFVSTPILTTNSRKKPKDKTKGKITRRRNALGLSPNLFSGALSILGPESTKNKYVFQRSEENLLKFGLWLDELIQNEILQPTLPIDQKWLSAFLSIAYTKGAKATSAPVAAKALKLGIQLPDNSPLLNPTHIDRAKIIYARSFNEMQGITDAMKSQMRDVLADGMIKGKNPREIARELNAKVSGIGKTRARLIARTEIVEAHQEAAILEAEQLEAATGFVIDMKWQTALDGRERDSHRARHGKVYSKEVARSLLGEPNCRCSLIPNIVVK